MSARAAGQPAHGWRAGAILWRCHFCAKTLGQLAFDPDAILIRHFKRVTEVEGAQLTIRQVCDDCGAENFWPPRPPEER